jgi:hypothetical protein
METPRARMFKPLSEPAVGSVRVVKDVATKIGNVIDDIPLSFPPDGRYFLALEGRSLHVYETSAGITSFTTRDAAAVKGVEVDGDVTTVTVSGITGVTEIVVHRRRGAAKGEAVTLEELAAPVSAMQEFSELAAKSSLSASERVRKVELLKEIQGVFVGAHQRSERARQRRSTPPSSGESRGFSSRSCG